MIPVSTVGALLVLPETEILLQLIVFGVLLGSLYTLVALGLTMIFGVMEVINLAHGALMVVGMYAIWALATAGVPVVVAMVLAVLIVGGLGAVMYLTTIGPFVDGDEDQNFLIVTLGWLLILVAGMELVFSPAPRSLDVASGSVGTRGVYLPRAYILGVIVTVCAVVIMLAFLYHTHLGRAIRATADDRTSAQYVGLNIRRIDTLSFAIGAGLAGLAGAVIPFIQQFDPHLGNVYLVTAFVVVVLGGLGSFKGVLVGGLFIGFIEVFGSFYLSGSWYRVLIFLIFLAVLLARPEGLFGGETRA